MRFDAHHVHLVCSDLETMENFFVEMLGTRFVERTTFGGIDGSKLMLGDIGIYLRLAGPTEKIDTTEGQMRLGYHHIGLKVKDLVTAHDELTAKGAVFTVPPTTTPFGVIAFLRGPDDIIVELIQPEV